MPNSEIHKIADELGLSSHQVQQVKDKLLAAGDITEAAQTEDVSVTELWETEFTAAKQSIKRRDIYAAAREARQQSHHLFEDQGLSSLSLVLAHLLADLIEEPNRVLEIAN